MSLKLGYKPSPAHKVGLGPLRELELTAGVLPSEAMIVVPGALDQLHQDCVANSGAVCIQHGQAVALGNPTGPWPELASRPFLYALLRVASGGALSDDDGGFIHSMVEAISHSGFPKESEWGPDGGKTAEGKDLLKTWPEWKAMRAAADQKLVNGARRIVSRTQQRVLDVATAIAGGSLVQWGTMLDQAFADIGAAYVWPGVRGPSIGGHAMYLHGFRRVPSTGRFQFSSRSSWSSGYADNGSAWVDEGAIASSDAEDFWIWDIAPTYSGTK